ncbi:hypothetical protein [Polyangium sorediatum]|uniref:Uncharacterized protein n=1 Tax=Polyangium sorediatum TaxID=889274 RepID=A0ABT6NL55_9BACT|nr:hypothetical protein [Polyangium sorediatum]MDI1429034.1 hypothetical protein [Polyangium sorediatum]
MYWSAVDEDATNFLLTSLKVAGYDVVGGSPINLASFLANVNRCDRPGPLTGRVFQSGTTVEATVRNIQSTPQLFHGLRSCSRPPIRAPRARPCDMNGIHGVGIVACGLWTNGNARSRPTRKGAVIARI